MGTLTLKETHHSHTLRTLILKEMNHKQMVEKPHQHLRVTLIVKRMQETETQSAFIVKGAFTLNKNTLRTLIVKKHPKHALEYQALTPLRRPRQHRGIPTPFGKNLRRRWRRRAVGRRVV